MQIRVVVILASGQFVNFYFGTKDDANKFIEEWAAACQKCIEEGKDPAWNQMIAYPDEEGRIRHAVVGKHVTGMYIPYEAPTASDRLAEASNRLASAAEEDIRMRKGGDEWKGEGD